MKKYLATGLLLLSIGCASNNLNTHSIELEGGLYMKGSSRFSYMVLEDAKTGQNYKIQNPQEFDLTKRQRQKVKVEAVIIEEKRGPRPVIIKILKIKN